MQFVVLYNPALPARPQLVAGRLRPLIRHHVLGTREDEVMHPRTTHCVEVGSQSLNTVDEDDADARHLLGPLLDDLGDGGPSTNRRG